MLVGLSSTIFPTWLSLSLARPASQKRADFFGFRINIFYLFFSLLHSGAPKPFRDIFGDPADMWGRLEEHDGGCQVVDPDPLSDKKI